MRLYHEWLLNFVESLFLHELICSYVFFLFSLIICWIAMIEFWLLNQLYNSGMNCTWFWCIMLFTGFDLLIFVMNFYEMLMRDNDPLVFSPCNALILVLEQHWPHRTISKIFPLLPFSGKEYIVGIISSLSAWKNSYVYLSGPGEFCFVSY